MARVLGLSPDLHEQLRRVNAHRGSLRGKRVARALRALTEDDLPSVDTFRFSSKAVKPGPAQSPRIT